MKTISIKTVTETVTSKGGENIVATFSTLDLIRAAVNNPPDKGFNLSEMMARLKIIGVVDAIVAKSPVLPETMELEDADYEKLKECVQVMLWAFLSPTVVEFCQSLT